MKQNPGKELDAALFPLWARCHFKVTLHSVPRPRCRVAIRWRLIKERQIGTTRTTAALRGRSDRDNVRVDKHATRPRLPRFHAPPCTQFSYLFPVRLKNRRFLYDQRSPERGPTHGMFQKLRDPSTNWSFADGCCFQRRLYADVGRLRSSYVTDFRW